MNCTRLANIEELRTKTKDAITSVTVCGCVAANLTEIVYRLDVQKATTVSWKYDIIKKISLSLATRRCKLHVFPYFCIYIQNKNDYLGASFMMIQ